MGRGTRKRLARRRLRGSAGRRGPRRGTGQRDTARAPGGRESRAGTAWQPSRPGPGVAPEGGARCPARGARAADPSRQEPLPRTGTDLSRARLGLAGRGLRSPSAGRRLARSPGPGRAASSPPGASEPGPGAAAAHPTPPAGPATTKGGGGARPGRRRGQRLDGARAAGARGLQPPWRQCGESRLGSCGRLRRGRGEARGGAWAARGGASGRRGAGAEAGPPASFVWPPGPAPRPPGGAARPAAVRDPGLRCGEASGAAGTSALAASKVPSGAVARATRLGQDGGNKNNCK